MISLHLFLSVLIAFFISILSLKMHLLTLKGSVATFVFALIIFYLGDIKWTVPILTFFVFSSLLSKFRKKINPKVDFYFQKTDERDHIQVMANGGFPGIIILVNQFFTSELFYIAYVSAIAAVCSDTWATEIGTFFNTKTFNIMDFKLVEQGISGGVSLIGFIGAVLGSVAISISAFQWINHYELLFIVIASGFFGSTFDSILGSVLQAKFRCTICKKIVEKLNHCESPTVHARGLKYLNNDGVNFASSTFGGLISFVLASLIL